MTLDFDSFVLAAVTTDLDEEPRAREHADAVEFRMDLADEPLAAIDDYDGVLPLIATNRAKWEGGEEGGADRLDDLAAATEIDAVRAIDVELNSIRHAAGERVVDHAREHDVAAIASLHDFDGTPSAEEMHAIVEDAAAQADVAKLAVTAQDPADVLALLMVTRRASAGGDRVATIAMGEIGRHSRVIAPIYGSAIGYAPVDPETATAPGQFDLRTLAESIERLG